MKNLICVFFVFFLCSTNAQDLTLMHINAKWNQPNNFDLKGIQNTLQKKIKNQMN